MLNISSATTHGFTMIELIMVIVILGVLSAMAIPRFSDLGRDGRLSSLKGIEGSLKSAMAIARSKVFSSGKSVLATSETILMDGLTTDIVYGAPAATPTGIGRAGDLVNSDALSLDYSTTGEVTIELKANCHLVYEEATCSAVSGSSCSGVVTAAQITPDISGC